MSAPGLPPVSGNVHISSKITEARYGHAWRDDKHNTIHATVSCGDTLIVLNDAATARQVAAECVKAADAMDALRPPEPSCAKCHAEPCKDGQQFGARCLDRCHEALEFDHCCMICATPEEARALGFPVIPAVHIEAEVADDVRRLDGAK
jgi:hypothetical protein